MTPEKQERLPELSKVKTNTISLDRQEFIDSTSDIVHPEILKKYKERISALSEETKANDKSKLSKSSIKDIRFKNHILTEEPTDALSTCKNLKEETARRINSYTDKFENGWLTLNYNQVGGDLHNSMIGLGDILVDPDIQVVEIEKRDGTKFTAERGVAKNGRVCFLYNGKYVSTYTGDKFRIASNNTETDESNPEDLKRYKEKVQKEEKQRRESRIIYETSNNYAKENPYTLLQEAGFENPEDLTNRQIIERFQKMSAEELVEIRQNIGADNLKQIFEQTGLNRFSQKTELVSEIEKQINALDENNPLVNTFGNKQNLIETLIKVAAAESAFKPFSWSETYCMGFFQYNEGNTDHYKKNPLNPKEAVEGIILLWEGNFKLGATTTENLIKAQLGIRRINTSEAENYLQTVTNKNPEDFNDDNNANIDDKLRVRNPISAAYETNPETGITLCSRTAYLNLNMLGINHAPTGNARDAGEQYDEKYRIRGNSNEEIQNKLKALKDQNEILGIDIYAEGSNTEAGRKYGHRAAGYLAPDEKYKILDPYINSRSRYGVEFKDYRGKILFVVAHTKNGPIEA